MLKELVDFFPSEKLNMCYSRHGINKLEIQLNMISVDKYTKQCHTIYFFQLVQIAIFKSAFK